MIGDLKNWHIQAAGANDSNNLGYYNQKPDSAIPNQNDPDVDTDVDNTVYYSELNTTIVEPKYPFKFKILPMRTFAAFGANITDLITMESYHYGVIQQQIDQLKIKTIDAFSNASGMIYTNSSNDNIGRKLWGQTQYLMAMALISNNHTLSNRVIQMFHATNTTSTSTETDITVKN